MKDIEGVSMRSRPLVLAFALVGVLLSSAPVFAHHGAVAYDMKKVTTLQGIISEFRYTNPHSEIYFDVVDANGKTQKWVAEAVSVPAMSRSGWTKNSLKPGDKVSVTGNVAKNGTFTMRFASLTFPDGRKLTYERAEDYAQ